MCEKELKKCCSNAGQYQGNYPANCFATMIRKENHLQLCTYIDGHREVKSYHCVSGEGKQFNFSFKLTPNDVVAS